MMGAGKSSVGRRLAARLGIPFVDADAEIESAAGMTIPEIFAKHGEGYFRAGEKRVIARLLDNGPQVLATGGGAIMDQNTRDLIHIKGISVWLKADLDVLMKRTKRRNDRPLAEKIKDLLPLREPVYALSDIVGAVARRAARHHRRRNHRRLPKHLGMPAVAEDNAMTAPLRQASSPTDRGAGRAGRARLRHRHRPRADRLAWRAHQGAAAGRQGARSSPTPPSPSIICRPPSAR